MHPFDENAKNNSLNAVKSLPGLKLSLKCNMFQVKEPQQGESVMFVGSLKLTQIAIKLGVGGEKQTLMWVAFESDMQGEGF